MSPEDVARRHESMPGYELVDYAEVALPIWQLSVEAVSIAHRKFTPIQEYVLRAIESGLRLNDTAGFLGLEESIVEGTLTQLISDRLVRVSATDSEALKEWLITEEGTVALQKEGVAVPVEDHFQILFDGIHRMPGNVSAEQIALPRDTDSGLLVELQAIPPNKPSKSDLSVADMQRALVKQSGGRSEFGRDLISIKRIARYRRLFKRGIGLVFKGTQDRRDLRLKIVVGGVRDEDTEHKFAEQGGLSRPGFIKAFSDAYLNANLRKHLGPNMSAVLLDGSENRDRQMAYSVAKLRMASIERKLAMVTDGELRADEGPSDEQVLKVKEDLKLAKDALNQPMVRSAAVYEQAEFFKTAFSIARNSIFVSSFGLSSLIVNAEFLEQLKNRLERGLSVFVTVDRAAYERDSVHPEFGRPYIAMQRLADRFSNLKLNVQGEDRYFHLAIDELRMLVSNRPFLSNSGRIRTFEQYSGYFVQEAELTKGYLDRVRPIR